jgi:preprotein translocase subunit SecY
MKRSDYFYTFLLLGTIALIVYGFLNFFWIMAGLIVLSSVFSFVVFLVQTRVKLPVENENHAEQPIDFYRTDIKTTYYVQEQRKLVNAD